MQNLIQWVETHPYKAAGAAFAVVLLLMWL
jgi:hypothetical protein